MLCMSSSFHRKAMRYVKACVSIVMMDRKRMEKGHDRFRVIVFSLLIVHEPRY